MAPEYARIRDCAEIGVTMSARAALTKIFSEYKELAAVQVEIAANPPNCDLRHTLFTI